jgi:tRNA (mo5U34)-methyltransferase
MEDRFAHVRAWNARRSETGWWHSLELPDGRILEGVSTLESQRRRLAQFPIPERLTGKRVLDIGTWDGWFAFEMERRGAEVVAIDRWDNPRFRELHAMLGSRVDYRQMDVYELTPERIGRFDIVLFMGVLYHLKHPLAALERVCALATDFAAVESFILREEHLPGAGVESRALLEFYETTEFGGEATNWCAPSLPCLLAFCRTAGFARVELTNVLEYSASVACYRRWEAPPPDAPEGPELADLFHDTADGINFQSRYDEYAACTFHWPGPPLEIADVKPEVGGYGVIPIHVKHAHADLWQVNFKLPPGLPAGWHDATLRIGPSRPGSKLRLAVDVPLEVSRIEVRGVRDARTGIENQLDLSRGKWLSLWIEGLPENADRNNLGVFAAGRRLRVTYIEPPRDGARQINIEFPEDSPPGSHEVRVAIGDRRGDPVSVIVSA